MQLICAQRHIWHIVLSQKELQNKSGNNRLKKAEKNYVKQKVRLKFQQKTPAAVFLIYNNSLNNSAIFFPVQYF